MINRVIYNDEVFYKSKDLKELYNCSEYMIKKVIKEQGIELHRLDGFGLSKFIKESDVKLIDVKGKSIAMRTAIKDKVDEVKSLETISFLTKALFDNVDIKMNVEDKTNESLDEFEVIPMDNNDEDGLYIELFNEVAEREGYKERLHQIKFICNNDKMVEYNLLVDGDGEIIGVHNYFGINLIEFEDCLIDGEFYDYFDSEPKKLNKGDKSEITKDELICKLFKKFNKCKYEFSCVDSVDVELSEGNKIDVSIELLSAIMFGNIAILK